MSNSQEHEEVSVSSGGVTVVKRFEADEFPVPAIAFEFSSDRDEAVAVTLSDDVPDGVAVEDLGFHPEYGSEYWTIDEDEIRFEYELEPDDEYTTVYGIRATGTENVEQFLTEPALESVEPPAEGDDGDSIPEPNDDVVRDVISGDGDVPGLDDEPESDAEESDADVDTLDLNDPSDSGGEDVSARETTVETDEGEAGEEDTDDSSDGAADAEAGDGDGRVSIEGESLVTALAAEIREQEVSAEDIELLREAFELVSDGSTEARIERLQSDIADLRAYTDALEEFLDENGTAQQLIEEFEQQIEEMEETVASMQSQTADTVERVEGAEDEIDSVSDSLDDLEETVSNLESDIESVQEQVGEADVADRLEEIESAIDDLQEWQEQIKQTFGG